MAARLSPVRDARFVLSNAFGQTVRETSFSGMQYRLERAGLSGGVYFYAITVQGAHWSSGKILLR